MRHYRISLTEPLKTGLIVSLDDATEHYLARVIRVSPDDYLQASALDGSVWKVRYRPESRDVEVCECIVRENSANPKREIAIWLPLLKGGKSELLVRQLTELGVSEIVVFTSERSVVRWPTAKVEHKLKRLAAIVDEAKRQCGRSDDVLLRYHDGLPTEVDGTFFWEQADSHAVYAEDVDVESQRLLTGPEGGLTSQEAEQLIAQGWRCCSLGPRRGIYP